jgi:hypothetical protein
MSAKTKKASARRVIKSSWPRNAALSDTMKISALPKENPYRDGTTLYNAFEALRKSKTVGQALDPKHEKGKTGTTRNYRRFVLRNLVHAKLAKVS